MAIIGFAILIFLGLLLLAAIVLLFLLLGWRTALLMVGAALLTTFAINALFFFAKHLIGM